MPAVFIDPGLKVFQFSTQPDQLGVNAAPTNQTVYVKTDPNHTVGVYAYTKVLQTDRDYAGGDTVRSTKAGLYAWVNCDNNDAAWNPIAICGAGVQSIMVSGANAISYGSVIAYVAEVFVKQVPTPASSHGNEYSTFYATIMAGSTANPIGGGNYWFFDHALHGPIGQPGRLAGYSFVMVNHYNGSPSFGKSAAITIQNAPGIGGQNNNFTGSANYPVDIGVHISGNATGAGTGDGFTNAFQVGGYGPVWIDPTFPSPYNTYGGDLGQVARGYVVKAKNAGPSVARLGAFVSEAIGEAGGLILGLDTADANRASTYRFANGVLGVTGSIRPGAGVGNARVPLWCGSGPAATPIANTVTPTSIFATVPTGIGSLTIPANTLRVGQRIVLALYGTYGATGTPTFNVQVKLGSTVILQGTSTAMTAGTAGNWAFDFLYQNAIDIQAIGSGTTGKVIGLSRCYFSAGGFAILTAAGGASFLPAQVSIDTTTSLLLDILFTWSVANPANTMQYLGGEVYLDG